MRKLHIDVVSALDILAICEWQPVGNLGQSALSPGHAKQFGCKVLSDTVSRVKETVFHTVWISNNKY